MAREVNTAVSAFGGAIEKAADFQLTWHRLDLANVPSMQEQVRHVKGWNRVGARPES